MLEQLAERLAIRKPTILVVGDVMLDHYRIGDAVRISPEAPVPVLLNPTDEYRLGGAGAVAAMCAALGADVTLIGVIGFDPEGEMLQRLAEEAGIRVLLSGVPDRRTTTKMRICAVASGRHRQQLARLDTETTTEIPGGVSAAITDLICRETFDAAILSDYAKGLVTDQIATACIWRQPTFVDPPKTVDWHDGPAWDRFVGCECIVPNREEACGVNARKLKTRISANACLLKKDSEGCELSYYDHLRAEIGVVIPAFPSAVADVTACGDQTIAMLAVCRAAGIGWAESAALSMLAAGRQTERYGAVAVTLMELDAAAADASSSCH